MSFVRRDVLRLVGYDFHPTVAKLFTHYDGYRRAEQISGGSQWWGLTFCAGTWSEGGDKMGKEEVR